MEKVFLTRSHLTGVSTYIGADVALIYIQLAFNNIVHVSSGAVSEPQMDLGQITDTVDLYFLHCE